MSDTRQLCTFFVRDLRFAVDVQCVQEVIRQQTMTHVPLAPAAVRGLINLRGELVVAIDLRQRLGLSPIQIAEPHFNIVIRSDENAVSLLVDEIGDVLEVDAARHAEPPATLQTPLAELVCGMYTLDEKLLLVLDTQEALDVNTMRSMH